MKRHCKCVARGKNTDYCDGCTTNSTKCPFGDKYRDLRNTKYLKKRIPQAEEFEREEKYG